MRMIGNILWHIPFLGFVTAFLTFLLGIILTALVVTAPIGLGLIQFSKFLLAPYSYSMEKKSDLNIQENPIWKTYSTILMILYLPIGIVLTLCSVFQVALLFMSIVGIPAAIPIAKSLGTYLNPVGKVCVPVAVSYAIQARKAQEQVDSYLGKN